MSNEVWKAVVGYEGYYEVSNMGRVKSLPRTVVNGTNSTMTLRERFLKPSLVAGYPAVTLTVLNKPWKLYVHRLVAAAFLANPSNKPEVNHLDLDTTNPVLTNLEWATRQENITHSVRAGSFHGITNPKKAPKLCLEKVRAIRELKKAGHTNIVIAAKFGVCNSMIGKILKNKTWANT